MRVIAEPGRYFAETAATLLTPIYGHRDRTGADGELKKDYWITDGLYGSFNCIIYDAQNPTYEVRGVEMCMGDLCLQRLVFCLLVK